MGTDRLGDLMADSEHRVERAHRLLEDDTDPLPADRPRPFLIEADEVDPLSRRGGGRSCRGGGALLGAQE